MNAAARQINQTSLFSGHLTSMRLSKKICLQMALLLMVLLSALTVVYMTNLHRMTLSELEIEEQRAHQLELQWGQLLLEQASLGTPARVEQLAAEKLSMILPTDKQTVILRVK